MRGTTQHNAIEPPVEDPPLRTSSRRLPASADPTVEWWPEIVAAVKRQDQSASTSSLLFRPLVEVEPGTSLIVAQLGQSLDGRIATHTGHSKYINGAAGLLHLHRLRCLVDAVVIGIGTALADDPLLTVRLCQGMHPARVVIDPAGRLSAGARVLNADGCRAIVVTTREARFDLPEHVEILRLDSTHGDIDPKAIVAALSTRGFSRLLVEGGAQTVSRFIQAGAIDRLHILVAPIILGSGQPGFSLPLIDRVDEALRPHVTPHLIGDEVVFDCDFRRAPR